MGFTANNIKPTSITANGVELNTHTANGVKVWGKPFALTIDAGENTTITVTRTSSPNQNAELGELSNGSLLYYGDTLKIESTLANSYTIKGLYITSGYAVTEYSSAKGQTSYVIESYTVTAYTKISLTAQYVPSWHQVFSGWQGHTNGITGNYKVSDTAEYTKTVPLAIDLSAYSFSAIRIVGQGTCSVAATVSGFDVTFNQSDIGVEKELTTVAVNAAVGDYTGSVQKGVWNGGSSVDFIVRSAQSGLKNPLTLKADFASAGVAVKNIYLYY